MAWALAHLLEDAGMRIFTCTGTVSPPNAWTAPRSPSGTMVINFWCPAEADLSTREGFERFILDYQKDVFRFLLRRGVPVQTAPDLRQDAFLVLWKDREKPRDPRAFLLGVANRLATAYHRESLQLPTVSLEETHADAPAADIDDAPDDAPQAPPPELAFALADLTPRQREVIDLVWLKDLSRGEAAARLGITQGALRYHEKRAFDALGKKISLS
jgi:RNA polymerase sigma-70 factor (ECF subfamily)